MPQPGEQFEGKYKIAEALHRGVATDVYRAIDVEVGRAVAIKVLHGAARTDGARARFAQEARAIAAMHSAHVVRLFDFGQSVDGLPFMVFEFVNGRPLTELTQRGPLPTRAAEHILRQLLSALDEGHSLGILHREVAPGNVLVFEYMEDPYRVKLHDFGVTKLFGSESNDPLTRPGTPVGSLRYMAPEQYVGIGVNSASDLYGLGLVLFEMLTGTPAIAGDEAQLLTFHASGQPVDTRALDDGARLTQICRRLLAFEPAERFQSAQQVVAALDAVKARAFEETASAPKARPPLPTALWIGIAACALVAVVAMALSHQSAPEAADPDMLRRASIGATQRRNAAPPAELTPVADMHDDGDARKGPCAETRVGGISAERLLIGLAGQHYALFLPRRDDADAPPVPVVFVLHKLDGEFLTKTRLARVAERMEFAVVSLRFGNDHDVREARDAVSAVWNSLLENECVDPQRRFLVAHADAARLARELTCEMPFSGLATTGDAQRSTDESCAGLAKTPWIRLAGRDDPYVPLGGGSSCRGEGPFLSAEEVETATASSRSCTSKPRSSPHPNGVCRRWECDAPFVSCDVKGGHNWPDVHDVMTTPGCTADPLEFPVSATIWGFFERYGVPLPRSNR